MHPMSATLIAMTYWCPRDAGLWILPHTMISRALHCRMASSIPIFKWGTDGREVKSIHTMSEQQILDLQATLALQQWISAQSHLFCATFWGAWFQGQPGLWKTQMKLAASWLAHRGKSIACKKEESSRIGFLSWFLSPLPPNYLNPLLHY